MQDQREVWPITNIIAISEKNISTDHRAQSHLSGGHTRQWLLIHCIASLALALQLTAGKGRQTLGYREKDIHSPFPSVMGQCIVLGKQNVKQTLLLARRASPPSRRGIELGLNKNVMHTTGHLLKDYKGQIKLYPFLQPSRYTFIDVIRT